MKNIKKIWRCIYWIFATKKQLTDRIDYLRAERKDHIRVINELKDMVEKANRQLREVNQ